jgi:predicted nucleotidyltransferase
MSKSELINTLTELNKETRTKYKSRIIGLFGSHARGEENDKSDIDLLIEKESGITIFDLAAMKIFLEEKLNASVDIVTTSALREEIKPYVMNDLIYI